METLQRLINQVTLNTNTERDWPRRAIHGITDTVSLQIDSMISHSTLSGHL